MASAQECERALLDLAGRLDQLDHATRRRHSADRALRCVVPDIPTAFSARLHDGALVDIAQSPDTMLPAGAAQIRLTVSSDDLVALTSGVLPVVTAWRAGRIKVEASMRDLIRLATLL